MYNINNMGTLNEKSSFLFARPSFLSGVASVLDLGGSLQIYNESKTPSEADGLAMRMDWLVVGDDIRGSMRKYEQQKQVLATA